MTTTMTINNETAIASLLMGLTATAFDFDGETEKALLLPIVERMATYLAANTGEKFTATAYYEEPSYYGHNNYPHFISLAIRRDGAEVEELYYDYLDMRSFFEEQTIMINIKDLPMLCGYEEIRIFNAADTAPEDLTMAALMGEEFITLRCGYDETELTIDESEMTPGNLAIMSEKDWEKVDEIIYDTNGHWDETEGYPYAAITNILTEIHAEWQARISAMKIAA